MTADESPIVVTLGKNIFVEGPETERSQRLLKAFRANRVLMEILPHGTYRFNIVEENGSKITTCESVSGTVYRYQIRMSSGVSRSMSFQKSLPGVGDDQANKFQIFVFCTVFLLLVSGLIWDALS